MQVSLSQEFTISRRCDFTFKKLNILYLKGKLKIGKNKYLNDFFCRCRRGPKVQILKP